MKLLVVAEDGPSAIVRSLLPGLRTMAQVTTTGTVDPQVLGGRRMVRRAFMHQVEARFADARFIEAVGQLQPDAVLVIKGRCLSGDAITRVRQSGVPVVVYYTDNPLWRTGDTGSALDRLHAADLVIVWSERVAATLAPTRARVVVVPFGYDDRWYSLTPPEAGPRTGIAFVGTWSLRRERYLAALAGLPLTVHGSAWERASVPSSGPVYEAEAGEVLRKALIGINLLHPQNAGAHNMRTREVVASGAVQITDWGTDGTPLRHGESCCWMRSPEELRAQVVWLLRNRQEGVRLASAAQSLVAGDTYTHRGETIGRLVASMVPR